MCAVLLVSFANAATTKVVVIGTVINEDTTTGFSAGMF